MVHGGRKYSLVVSLTWASFVWGQSPIAQPSNTDQPTDWHRSWDKAYGEKPKDSEASGEKKASPPIVPAQPVSRENQSLELPETRVPPVVPSRDPGSIGEGIFPSVEPPPEPASAFSTWTREASWETADLLSHDFHLIWEDYGHYWTYGGIGRIALGIAAAAPIANTGADLSIRNWYQNHVRRGWEDRYALDVKYLGEYAYELPAYFGIALGGWALEGLDSSINEDGSWVGEVGGTASQWGQRCIRAMAVGTPMVGVLQVGLGSTRPGLGSSYWNPFNASHGVSGHAYVGSVPFLTAAAMTDNPVLKVPLFLGSFLTSWSRIHTDAHYFSQVALGWWMGYLAVRSVNETQEEERTIEFLPGSTEGPGVSMLLRY
jgi:hypothetical protein